MPATTIAVTTARLVATSAMTACFFCAARRRRRISAAPTLDWVLLETVNDGGAAGEPVSTIGAGAAPRALEKAGTAGAGTVLRIGCTCFWRMNCSKAGRLAGGGA